MTSLGPAARRSAGGADDQSVVVAHESQRDDVPSIAGGQDLVCDAHILEPVEHELEADEELVAVEVPGLEHVVRGQFR